MNEVICGRCEKTFPRDKEVVTKTWTGVYFCKPCAITRNPKPRSGALLNAQQRQVRKREIIVSRSQGISYPEIARNIDQLLNLSKPTSPKDLIHVEWLAINHLQRTMKSTVRISGRTTQDVLFELIGLEFGAGCDAVAIYKYIESKIGVQC